LINDVGDGNTGGGGGNEDDGADDEGNGNDSELGQESVVEVRGRHSYLLYIE